MEAVSERRRTAGFILAAALVHAALLGGWARLLHVTFAPLPRAPTVLRLQPHVQGPRSPAPPGSAIVPQPVATGETRRIPPRLAAAPKTAPKSAPARAPSAAVAVPAPVAAAAAAAVTATADPSVDLGAQAHCPSSGDAMPASPSAAAETAGLTQIGHASPADRMCKGAVHLALLASLRRAGRAVRGVGRTGDVTLIFTLDAAGAVTDVAVTEPRGAALLGDAARTLLTRATLPSACAGQYRWPLHFSPHDITPQP